jgi:hypothetical protein
MDSQNFLGYPYSSELTIMEGKYVENNILDMERIDAYLQGNTDLSSMINSSVVYAYGNSANFGPKNFPILFQTQGMGNKKGYQSYDNQVKKHMLGKPKRTSVIAKTIYGDNEKVGISHTEFILYFRDNHFTKGEFIIKGSLGRDYQIQLLTEGEKEGNLFKFRGKIVGNTPFIPASILKAGEIWGDGVYKVSLEHSRGNVNRTYTPYVITNTLSLIRQSINVAGNSVNKKMSFTIQVDGRSFQMYYDWEKHLTMLAFMANKEQDLIMSKSTKDRTGHIHNYDVNSGKPIPSGNGFIGQVPKSNILSYYKMTERKLDSFLTDVMSIAGSLDTDSNTTIDIMGGWDLLNNIDKALTRSSALVPSITNDTYVRKASQGNGLQFGNYFTEYRHRSGVVFRFQYHSFFDESAFAQTSGRNPYTGRPKLSSEGIIMNFGRITGSDNKEVPNIEYMYEEGREYIEGTVRGMSKINGMQGGDMSTDIDASAMHIMCSQGLHLHSPLAAGYVQFNLR